MRHLRHSMQPANSAGNETGTERYGRSPMDFDLSADQADLQAGARDLLDGYAAPARVRDHIQSAEPYDPTLWSAMAEQGWCAVAVPEGQGGLGLGWVEVAVLLSEVGRHTAPVPLLPTLVTLAALTRSGTRDSVVEALAAGTSIGATAWSARHGAVSVESGDGDAVTLTGRLGPTEGASVADVLVVVLDDGVFLIEPGSIDPPVRQPAMDVTRALAWVDLDRTPAVRIGDRDDAVWVSRARRRRLVGRTARGRRTGAWRWPWSTPRTGCSSVSPSGASRR